MELFEKLVKENSIWDAQIVGKNLFCQNSGEVTSFKDYFDFCINVATGQKEIETRMFFANEAELALNVFSEKCRIEETALMTIQNSRSKLVQASKQINEVIQQSREEQERITLESNNRILSELSKLKREMLSIKTQAQFDAFLNKMSSFEEGLDKTVLTPDQTTLYNSLTRDFSALVSQKMAEISHNEDIKYNKEAADSFKEAFEKFKADEGKFKKSDSELYGLVSRYLFAYDAKRLFNECLVYYNHVYSYIFNKLDDDGKFRFTQFSFDSPKN